MTSNSHTWQTPLFTDKAMLDSDQWIKNVVEPAERAMREELLREPIAEIAEKCDLSNPGPKTFDDMGSRPFRFKRENGSCERIFPFTNVIKEDGIKCAENPDYFGPGLVQVSQRLKEGREGPRFKTNREDIEASGAWQSQIQVQMTGFDENDFEFEVVTT